MTKDGRPSRICDIRIFAGDLHTYLEGHAAPVAFAHRMAWFLNGEDFSIGAHTHLYLFLSTSMTVGKATVTEYGADWWQRYTHVGTPGPLTESEDAQKFVADCVVQALKANRPDLSDLIDAAAREVGAHGAAMRFPLKTNQSKRYTAEASFTIGAWKIEPSLFHVLLTDQQSGEFLDAPPVELMFHEEAFDLAGSVKVSENAVHVSAHESFSAQITARRYGWPLAAQLADLKGLSSPPPTSKLVRRRG